MHYRSKSDGHTVTVSESAVNSKAGSVKYTVDASGETFFISKAWFERWYTEVPANKPRWSAVVEKSTSNEFWQYRMSNNGKPAGVMTGFATRGDAQYAATRMAAKMNTLNTLHN